MKLHDVASVDRWMLSEKRDPVVFDTDGKATAYAEHIWQLLMCSDLDELAEFVAEMEASRPGTTSRAQLCLPTLELTERYWESVTVKTLLRRRAARLRPTEV